MNHALFFFSLAVMFSLHYPEVAISQRTSQNAGLTWPKEPLVGAKAGLRGLGGRCNRTILM